MGAGSSWAGPEQNELGSAAFARELGITVAAVQSRLAPEHPFPSALEDCYAALQWLHTHAERLGIQPSHLAMGGASAGGGLAAALAQVAHDRQQMALVFQLLARSTPVRPPPAITSGITTATGLAGPRTTASPGRGGHPPYAIPARREDLKGLPPAWMGVGTLELFLEEDTAYARRLEDSGVACTFEVMPGAYHGFDTLAPKARVTRDFRDRQVEALRRALFPDGAVYSKASPKSSPR